MFYAIFIGKSLVTLVNSKDKVKIVSFFCDLNIFKMSQRFAPGQPGPAPVPGTPRYQAPPSQTSGMRPYTAGGSFPVSIKY